MFSAFDLNHSYHDTDVMISLAKLKRHITAGVTLSMKNLFGLTPNSLYGSEAGSEKATEGRIAACTDPDGYEKLKMPGLKPDVPYKDPFSRVPRIVVDVCAARPIDLAIIDGISAMTGGEGPWCAQAATIKLTTPGVLIAGIESGFDRCGGHSGHGLRSDGRRAKPAPSSIATIGLLLAEQAGLGSADLARIDVRGRTIEQVALSL